MKQVYRIGVGMGVAAALLIIIVIIAVTTGGGGSDDGPTTKPWTNVRLPESIRAVGYNLNLDIDWANMNYTGTQEASLNVTEHGTYYLLIHVKDLTINRTATTLTTEDGTPIELKDTFMGVEKDAKLAAKHDFYVVQSVNELPLGVYKLTIHFGAKVQTAKLTGMYRSAYKKDDGTDVYQISTDFEPVDARSAFPCLDEPSQKATWSNTIRVKFPDGMDITNYNIISNAQETKAERDDTKKVLSVNFEKSIAMSTYLVCFAISDFQSKEAKYVRKKDGSEVLLRVWARRETKFQDSLAYALEVTPKILEKYEEFYGVDYPLKKLDQIAFPQFNSGAMENWGIITYRESSLLYDVKTSSMKEKQRVCAVIAHEVAHQWFGNTVTMAWWNDLWLNEGFASFVEYYGIENAEPNWDILNFFYPDEIVAAMDFDSSPSSHPIVVSVSSPEELNGLFDTISYRKGSSINWMMQNFMGEDNFRAGLAHYIKLFKWGNAEMIDLFEALNTAAPDDMNVTEIMLTWTQQMGFPYLTVKIDGTKMTVMQDRFLRGEAKKDDLSPYGYKWHVPFQFIGQVAGEAELYTSTIHWLTPDKPLEITLDKEFTWVKGNAGGKFYYITTYDDNVWTELGATMEDIPEATDRTSLLYDAFNLAKTDKLSYGHALNLTLGLAEETEYVVMYRGLVEVLDAKDLVLDEAAKTLFKNYIVELLEPTVTKLGFTAEKGESIADLKMRDLALRNYLKNVANATNIHVDEALGIFDKFVANPATEKGNIADIFVTITRTAIIYDDEIHSNWDAMWDLLQKSEWEADQKIYIAALAKTNSNEKRDKMIEESFKPKPKSDCYRYLYYIAIYGGNDGLEYAWEKLKDRWADYTLKYNSTSFSMGYLVEIPAAFDTQLKYTEVENFFNANTDTIGTGLKTVSETLATIKTNIEKQGKYGDGIAKWIKDYYNTD